MYLVTFEDDSKVVKISDNNELYELCREINEDTLDYVEEDINEDAEDMETSRIKELLSVYTEGISVYKIRKVVSAVKNSELEDEEKRAILDTLKDPDIEEFDITDFDYLTEILADIDEESF